MHSDVKYHPDGEGSGGARAASGNRGIESFPGTGEIREMYAKYLFPAVMTYYAESLPLVRGRGTRAYDADGTEYLDFFGGILTVSMGHCDEKITSRIADQLWTLQHVSTLYPTVPIGLLARKLAEITPGSLCRSFFTNSGTEADETAIMLSKLATGSNEVVVLRHSYSGRGHLAMTCTGQAPWRVLGDSIPGVKHLAAPYCYRCPFGLEYPGCNVLCARDLEELILTTTPGRIAAFMAEPIFGVGGFIVPPREYFEVVLEIVHRYGGLFIADEVQTGFGRTGQKWFGIEHWNVTPDIITVAKGVANGLPLGATITTDEVASRWKGLTISTFGGNPVSSAAALATIEAIEERGILDRAHELGGVLRERLEALQQKYEIIGDVRGMGLMQAIEIVENKTSRNPSKEAIARLMEATRKRRLLIGKGSLYGNVVRIAPPMDIDVEQIEEACRILDESLAEVVA